MAERLAMILLTGGSGLLGRHLFPLLKNATAPSHAEFDILKSELPKGIDYIINAAAYTDVNGAETNKEKCWNLNVLGPTRLAGFDVPVMQISTDSVFSGEDGNYDEEDLPYPQNFYSYSKLMGEVGVYRACNCIVRTSFKPNPWVQDYAFHDQYSSSDYVEVIAQKIAQAIEIRELLPKILHIGTERKSTYELAKRTKPDVLPISLKDVFVRRPKDTSLNTSLWEQVIA